MQLKLVVAVSLVAVAAQRAAADRVVLHSKDSMTIDGKKYACDDPSTDGVSLAIGDRLTVGSHDLRCKAGGGGGAAAAKPPDVAVESRVDAQCLSFLLQTIDGMAPPADAIRWADTCRGFEIGRPCTVTSSTADDQCFATLNHLISGSFSDREILRAQSSCKVMQATCPALPTAVVSKVDLGCLDQLYQGTSGKPSSKAALAWLGECRDHPVGACTVVGGAFDMQCVNAVFQMIDGHLSPADAGTAARACRTLQLACP